MDEVETLPRGVPEQQPEYQLQFLASAAMIPPVVGHALDDALRQIVAPTLAGAFPGEVIEVFLVVKERYRVKFLKMNVNKTFDQVRFFDNLSDAYDAANNNDDNQ